MAASTSTAANASMALAAGRRILEIQFRCCGAFLKIDSSSKLKLYKNPALTRWRMIVLVSRILALEGGSKGYRM